MDIFATELATDPFLAIPLTFGVLAVLSFIFIVICAVLRWKWLTISFVVVFAVQAVMALFFLSLGMLFQHEETIIPYLKGFIG